MEFIHAQTCERSHLVYKRDNQKMIVKNNLFSHLFKASLLIVVIGFIPLSWSKGVAVDLLIGGNRFDLDHEKNIVFPPEFFRTDTFNLGNPSIDFEIAAGITDDFGTCAANNIPYLSGDILLGIYAYYNQTSRDGTVLEYGLPDFANSSYNMNVRSGRLMLDAEFDFQPVWMGLTPFIEGGIGIARNTLNFENNPRPNIGADGGNYSLPNNSQIQFAYQLGAGFKIPICNHMVLSARYLYANAGNAESNKYDSNTGVTLEQPIKVNVNSQSILLGLSYSLDNIL